MRLRVVAHTGVPRVLHYGLLYSVMSIHGKWEWDKHWFHEFDVHKCPPWDLNVPRPQEGVFPPPPGLDELLPNVRMSRVESTGGHVCVVVVVPAASGFVINVEYCTSLRSFATPDSRQACVSACVVRC